MSVLFRGTALPLDQEGISNVTNQMGITAAELWAVLNVETRGCGFLPDRRPFILYERHIFSRKTEHKFDGSYPDISNKEPGGYGAGGAAQYQRLERALKLDRKAALQSASWGIGQVMGFNAETAGYSDVEEMVTAMTVSENDQLLAMTGEIMANKLHHALHTHDWAKFAKGYNGIDYAKNHYDTRLYSAYQKFSVLLPNIIVRTAQVYLMYLGFNPGPVDGLLGRFTFSALHEFQQQNGLPIANEFNEELLLILNEKAFA
jgi:hypothetical protein